MEIIIEIIFEIFGEILDSTDELYKTNKKGRKWKYLIHGLSILKIIFFGIFAILFILLGFDSTLYVDDRNIVWGIICFLLALMFLWATRCSIKAYKTWRKKIKNIINDKLENIAKPASDEEFNKWLYGENK